MHASMVVPHGTASRGHQSCASLCSRRQILAAKGGSAIDAAIAANAVLGVPSHDERHGRRPFRHLLGCENREALRAQLQGMGSSRPTSSNTLKPGHVTAMPETGIDTVTVPGAVAGWNALHGRFGKLPWKDIFQSAIFCAERGYPVPELIMASGKSVPTISSRSGESPRFSSRRQAARLRRNFPESRSRQSASHDCQSGCDRVLQR